jgi:hypothetical protein
MIKLLGENYYIDLDKIEAYLDVPDEDPTQPISGSSETKINVIKFDLVKLLLETVLSEQEIVDDKLGMKGNSTTSVPFKLAFNSLLNKNLINHY